VRGTALAAEEGAGHPVGGTEGAGGPVGGADKVAGSQVRAPAPVPRLGFVGLGWIGRNRLEAAVQANAVQVVALADPSESARRACLAFAPDARECDVLDDLLTLDLDGIVIATPSALHAGDAQRALRAGTAVFCQKPLGRSEEECRRVIEAARAADRRLGVDFCYRQTRAAEAVKALVRSGALGRVYALDLVFHNAYGPDKPWFYRRTQSGGGCLLDLGTHLVDLAMWLLDEDRVDAASGTLMYGGSSERPDPEAVEDFATADLVLGSGARARLACSWRLPAGADAVIAVHVWGTEGGAAIRNVAGSYHDFVAERYRGTACELLTEPPDAWGGRTLVSWAHELARSPSYDPGIEGVLEVSRALDRIYT
jgi:predicted dehydrogenase